MQGPGVAGPPERMYNNRNSKQPRRGGGASPGAVKLPSLEGQPRLPDTQDVYDRGPLYESPTVRNSQQLPPLEDRNGYGSPKRKSPPGRHKQTQVAEVEPDFHGEIVTGTDVIEYYATYGHDARIKVFHCNKRYGRHEGSPYELLVVPRDQVDKEYYTITASGVVYCPGDPNFETEFIPIGEWLRETSIYNLMRTLKFFKYYFTQKMFRIWRKNSQGRVFQRVREKLETRLFLAKPDFCKCIMDLRGLLFELNQAELIDINTETAHQLRDLVPEQTEHRKSKMLPFLERLVQRMVQRVWVHCQDVSTAEVLMRKEVEAAANDPSNGATKGASTTRIKMERMERAKRHRQLVKDVGILSNLVRLADYMLVESEVELLTETMQRLQATFSTHSVLLTAVSFTDDGISFSPTDDEVLVEFNTRVIEETVKLVKGLPRILEDKTFTMLFPPPAPRGADPTTIIISQRSLNSARRSVDSIIRKSFQKAADYSAVFEEVRMVQHFKSTWDEKEYKAVKRDVKEFRQDMMLLKQWSDDVTAMKVDEAVGVLHVDSHGMQADLQATLNKALDVLKQLLTVAARKECLSVLETFSKLEKRLGDRPVKLEDFAAFYANHVELGESKAKYADSNQMVLDMYEMLTTYGGKIPPNDQLNLDDLKDMVTAYNKAMEESAAYIDERKAGMISVLQKNAKEMFSDLQAVVDEMHSGKYDKAEKSPKKMMEHIKELTKNFNSCDERAKRFASYEALFGLQPSDYSRVDQANKELQWHSNKWTYLHDFINLTESWYEGQCGGLDPEVMQSTTDEYTKWNYKMGKMRKDDTVVARLHSYIEEFKLHLPLLVELANPALEGRHWEQIFAVMGVKYQRGMEFTPRDLLDNGILTKMESVQTVCASASKEYSMLKTLEKMEAEFAPVEFRTMPYKDTGTFVLGGIDEIQLLLDDQIVKVQAMNASPFVKPFMERAKHWEKTLITMQDMLDNWLKCQSTWLYLEPIFSSEDIVKQMPEEGEKFRQVDNMWRAMQQSTHNKPSAVQIAQDESRVDNLIEANELLEDIQKGLAAYLEKKRLYFPRFFFLSNDEMLEILSETKDPTRVQPHLKKCFEGIDQLDFQEDLTITAMISIEKESVPFKNIIDTNKARGSVEKWLVEVEERMFESIHHQTSLGLEDYSSKPRHEWVLQWPGMVVLVVTGMFWTKGVEDALGAHDIKEVATFEAQCTSDLMKIVDLVRGDLTKLERATLGALVVMDVHARDVVTNLVKDDVTTLSDFAWQAQLRTYWEADEEGDKGMTTMMRMMSAEVEYGYEYLGNSSRLVITPLTDRCYRTLIGAIHLTLGGAPEGPAGTGKTETTKDLAKALARQCVVFNCSDSLDYIAMGKFFKGLASSGAWACFDEFNRIDLEVLSVVAQQVLDIQRAVGQRLRRFLFEGTEMQLKWSAWCSITMNPGYAGRSELPDNLKALFRTVAMMVPDYAMISEIILYSNGYLAARDCAKKIVQCYKLCSEQLSSQDHYDYGMRAVIAVLRAAGNLKRRFPNEDEYVLMLRSIIDVNLCKFLSHDVPLFQGIISDLFPGVTLPKPDYNLMEAAMRETCVEMNLQPTDYFFLKTIQLYEMIVVRHGLMIVGLPFSGKTSSYRVLAGALTKMHDNGEEGQEKTEYHVINPKSITMGQLYGQFDPVSHEWTDGILAVTFRACASNPSPDRKWLLLDGPVDAIWIENMNTVLDDNKKLCLNSGEIIQMSPQMNMIFEVMDLAVASPATVSRCGMVYLEPHQLGWRPLVLSWIAALPEHMSPYKEHLLALFDWLVPVSLRFNRREIKEGAPTLDSNLVCTLMRIFTSMADHLYQAERFNEMEEARIKLHLESLFLFALTWSIGATSGAAEGRKHFDVFIRVAVACGLPDYSSPSGEKYTLPEDIPEGHTKLSSPMVPDTGDTTIHDWLFDVSADKWVLWESRVDDSPIDKSSEVRKIIVPTIDTVRYTYLVDIAMQHKQPILLVGPTGTGKSAYMMQYLYSMDTERFATPIVVGFSARTSANMTQYLIDAKLDRRRKGVYGPPAGKEVCIFVDDLNMPQLETYGAQPPIELLRQYMDHGGWYDRANTFRAMVDCMFCAAMGPPGGGRSNITPRYQRHFNLLSVVDFDTKVLSKIFVSILDWYMVKEGFPENISEMKSSVIAACIEVYGTAMGQLLPTPTKSHYTFNLRDISRVMQGLLLIKPSQLGKGAGAKEKFLRLWTHEILRVFYDRLVDADDCNWFLGVLKDTFKTHFNDDLDRVFRTLSDGQPVVTEDLRRLFFGDYMSEEEEQHKRVYDEVPDVTACMSRMEELLVDHNATSKRPMNLAIFLYAVEQISRICRVLKQPGGHMLNVGLGGSGRQSLTRLSAFICGMETFQIEISKSYAQSDWRDDLKRFTRQAGATNTPAVFLFSDSQIKFESFVEDINNLLNAGEVPNMFPYDERAAVLESCRIQAKKDGLALETPAELWLYFIDRTKANLHIVLCFSPIGDAFRERLRQFPSLVNCCTIDWFKLWPKDALEAVAMKFLKDVDVADKQRRDIMAMCETFHVDVRNLADDFLRETGRTYYLTPTSYLELITMFTSLLGAKRSETETAKRRYGVGLEKLEFTAGQVKVMQDELTALKPDLEKTVVETDALMAKVQKEKTEVVEPKKAVVDKEVEKAKVAADAANAIKQECEEALGEAMPILNAAIAALDTIKPADIKLVQSFKNPPATIKLVLEAVCVLLQVKPARVKDPNSGQMVQDYWESSKKLLSDPNFVTTLKEYDKDNVPPKVIDTIRKTYTSNPDFTPTNAAKASSAAEGMCKWVCAMDSYDKVAKVVAPKRASLAVAQAEYDEVMKELGAKEADLKEVMDALARMEEQLERSTAEKVRLQGEVELCTQKLDRAEKLIGGLGGEKVRWTEAAARLGVQYTNLTGDMLISAGVISYLGAFTMLYRDRIVGKWVELCKEKGIPTSKIFSLQDALGEPVKIREWSIHGLPNDSFSIDNGIMVANARRWPLMIDPQGQANKWVKSMEKEFDLRVIKLTDGDYLRTLENAVQFGIPVLLENVGEELDPSLEPLLLKQIFKQGGVNYIRMGDATVEFSDQFRFYITTTLRNPHYLPEAAVKVTLLNFMITQEGLSDQLLGVVVAEERPDLEMQRQKLVVESAENKRKLKEIEDRILHVLSSSEGNILEDATAIQILSEAKVVSNEIQEKEIVAEQTQREIEAARVGYRPCGAYNAVLFFCVRDMAGIDPMYQYSLGWFIGLFVRAIQNSTKTDELQERLGHINAFFTYSLYQNICRSLFEKDKLLFSFLLDARILMSEGALEAREYTFLLTGGVGVPEKEMPVPADWIEPRAWGELCRLANVSSELDKLPEDVTGNQPEWKALFDSVEPHRETLPSGWQEKASHFQRVMILRCLRPDKVVPAIQDFVAATLGQKFVEPPPFDLEGSYNESSVSAPLLFVLSPGSDPTAALLKFADDRGFGSKVSVISMGQGQGPKASAIIADAMRDGTWALLQNCHLAASWMPTLEKIVEGIKPDTTDPDFRLWLTSMPSPHFPVTILQNGVKMTNEPPAGVRANLKRSFHLDPISDPDFFGQSTKPKIFKALLFGLCFVHAFVQERRKFGPIGWNIPYGFDDGDLRISVRQLRMYVDENEEVPFAALKYAIGECNYGGRVTDDKDRRLLNTILDCVYCPDVLTDRFKLSASGTYYIPEEGESTQHYIDYINTLPILPMPEVFGLHENADIAKDQRSTQLMFETLLLTGGSGGGGGGGGEEALVDGLVKDILARMPANFDIEKAQLKYPVLYEESMNQVLCQEMLRYNRLVSIIRTSLVNLEKAIAGLQVMSGELEKVFRSMAVGQVPELWKGKSFPSLKPLGSYVDDLIARLRMLEDWYEHGQPATFWLPGFFFTPSFTTAALQNYARHHKLPIDAVGYDFEMMGTDEKEYTEGPEDGVYVYGMFLDGCAWDKNAKQLCESKPKVLYVPAPVIYLKPKRVEDFEEFPHYSCPVYRTPERKGVLATTGHSTNFLMMIRMPTELPEHHWTLRGVCMLCSLDF